MCIRDRIKTIYIDGEKVDLSTKTIDDLIPAENIEGIEAVSYTHLDVYKRQTFINRQRAFPVWRSILLQGIHPVFPYRPQRVWKRLPEESYRESLMSLNSTSLLTIA